MYALLLLLLLHFLFLESARGSFFDERKRFTLVVIFYSYAEIYLKLS